MFADLDLRPIEAFTGWVFWPSTLVFGVGPAMVLLPFAAIVDRPWIPLLSAVCLGLVGLPASVALVAFLRWSRTGRARWFLAEVADLLGDGTPDTATWLFPALSPRLEGTVDGRRFRIDLRRTAGFLSPPTVGRKFLIWGWSARVQVAATGQGPLCGAGPKGAVLADLLGLSGPVVKDELTLFGGRSEAGARFAADPAVPPSARVVFDVLGPGFVRVDGSGARSLAMLPGERSPEDLARAVRELATIAGAWERAVAA